MEPVFIRAFFALDLPVEQKHHLVEAMAELKEYLEKKYKTRQFRWVKAANLHITLQFMAALPEEALLPLLQQVRSVLRGLKSFYLQLGQPEWFPSTEVPRVLSLKTEHQDNLRELSAVIGKAMVACAYPVEDRPFRGHLTLARVEGLHHLDPEYLSAFAWPGLPEIFINEIVLFKSEPQRGGSIYTRLASIQLGGEN